MPAPAGDRRGAVTGRVQAFLDTQRALTSFYAAEGRDTSANWPDSHRKEPTSPMLVPRAAAARDDGLPPTAANSATLDKSGLPSSIQASPVDCLVDLPSNLAVNVPIRSKKSTRSQLKTGPKATEPDESEHSQRLAQRRDRRRARRSATRAVEEDDVSDVVHELEHGGGSKKNKHKTKGLEEKPKSKKAKVAPALLLMQNFSAQNLGRSRLTIKPSATVGVFNKGKASGKLEMKKRPGKFKQGESIPFVPWAPLNVFISAPVMLDIVFSESAFLNKARAVDSEGSDNSEDESDDSSVHSAYSALRHANRQKAKSATVPQVGRRSHKEPRVDQNQNKTRGSPSPPPGSIRKSSPPWDIERQGTPSSIEITSPPLAKDKSLVIQVDNCAWSSKLQKHEQHTTTSQPLIAKSVAAQSQKEQALRPTVSSYFSAPQVQAVPPTPSPPLSPVPLQEIHHSTSEAHRLRITQTPSNPIRRSILNVPPSDNTPPHPIQNDEYMRAPGITSPHPTATTAITYLPHFETHYADPTHTPDTHEGWHFDSAGYHDFVLPIDPGDVQGTLLLDDAQDMELLDGNAWDGLEYDEGVIGYDPAPDDGGEEVYEGDVCGVYPGLQYDDGFTHDGVLGPRECEEELVYAYEDGEDFVAEDFQDGYDAYDIYMQPEDDLPEDQLDDMDYEGGYLDRTDFNGDYEEPALLPSDLDFAEEFPLDDDEPADGEDMESVPRLVRIITEASLEEDLFKSIGNHWGAVHRLY